MVKVRKFPVEALSRFTLRDIEDRSIPVPESGCWLWLAFGPRGYGVMSLGRKGQKMGAHRMAWALANGPIPDDMFICHKCDTPPCVNPDHLFVGTALDNMRDRADKGRCNGEWNGRCKLTNAEVLKIREYGKVVNHDDLGLSYGLSRRSVTDICRGVTWTHLR